MASKIVDDEIEQHLLEKINHAIQRRGDKQNLVSKYYSLDPDFDVVKSILEPNTNPLHNEKWSSLRRENLYYLNNLLNEWQLIKKRSTFAPLEGREACANIKKSLKKMMKELKGEESSSRGDPEHSVSHHQDPKHPIFERNKEDVYRWSSRHGPRKVHGFEHNAMAMERELVMRNINAPYKVFGIVGVAGIGKTTLCQDIFGRKLVRDHFCPRIWVCLSKQPRDNDDYRKEIVIRILRCLRIEDEVINATAEKGDGHGLRKLILLLRLQLIGKRYLIVLDDAWNDDEFFLKLTRTEEPNMKWGEELAYALPKGCGGAIISSGRSDVLLKKMLGKDVSLLYLKPHTDEIINEIFRDTVIGYDEDEKDFPTELEDLKMEIVKRCDGIPLAAKLFAKIARQSPLMFPPPPPTNFDGGNEINQILAGGGEQLKDGVDVGGGGSGSGGHEDIQFSASGGEQLKRNVDAGGSGNDGHEDKQVLDSGREQLKGGAGAGGSGNGSSEYKQVPVSGGERLKDGVDAGDGGSGRHEDKQVPARGGEQLKDGVNAGGSGSGNGSHEDKHVETIGGKQLKDGVDAGGDGSSNHEDKQVPTNGDEQLKDGIDAGGSGNGGHEDKHVQTSSGEQSKDGVDAGGDGRGSHEDKQVPTNGGKQLKDDIDAGDSGNSNHEDKQVHTSTDEQLKDSVDAGGSGNDSHEDKHVQTTGGKQLKDGVDAGGDGSGSHEDKQVPTNDGEQLKAGIDADGSGNVSHEDKHVQMSSDEQLKDNIDTGGGGGGSHENKQVPTNGGEQLKNGVLADSVSHEDKQVLTSGGEQLKSNV